MRFGLFGSAQAKRGGPDHDSSIGFKEFVEYNVEAEALGYVSTFVVEHHFTGFGQVSASLHLLSWVASRTKTLRLGTAVLVLPWHNPVLLAEQAATIDLLSDGRLDFGVGKGYRHNEFAGFCIPMEEAEARFEESLAVITKAFTHEQPWSHRGRFWQFDNVVVEPPTAQKPHPPFWMGAGSPNSIRQVAERGYNLLLDQYSTSTDIAGRVALFKSEVEARGRPFDPMQVGVARAIHVAKDKDDLEAALHRRAEGRMRMDALARIPGVETRGRFLASYDDVRATSDESALYGTPDDIIAKLEILQKAGIEYVLLNSSGSIENLRRFARDVMPAVSRMLNLAEVV